MALAAGKAEEADRMRDGLAIAAGVGKFDAEKSDMMFSVYCDLRLSIAMRAQMSNPVPVTTGSMQTPAPRLRRGAGMT